MMVAILVGLLLRCHKKLTVEMVDFKIMYFPAIIKMRGKCINWAVFISPKNGECMERKCIEVGECITNPIETSPFVLCPLCYPQ